MDATPHATPPLSLPALVESLLFVAPGPATLDQLRVMLAVHPDAYAFDEDYPLHCGDARGLLRHLKGIGAVVPVDGRDPVSPATLRAVMRRFDEGGARDGYHVLFGRVTRLPG